MLAAFEKNEITERCKGVHCVDLGESFQTHIFLQKLASIQPRTSPVNLARPSRFRPGTATQAGEVAEETVIALGDGSLVPAASAADLRPDDSSPEAGTLRVPEAKDTAAESLFISRLRAATGLAFQIWSR